MDFQTLSITTTAKGDYEITFKATDKLGHESTLPYAWTSVECIYDNVTPANNPSESPDFTQGTKTRVCQNDDTWAVWTYACTSDAYRLNVGETACITCPIGKYLSATNSDDCTAVSGNQASLANDHRVTECTSSEIVKDDKSACMSNACVPAVTNGVGKITTEGGPCQVSSCVLGYYKDPDADNDVACIAVTDTPGKYSPAARMDALDCTPKPKNSVWEYTALKQADATCDWGCAGGFTKDDDACHKTSEDCDIMVKISDTDTKIGRGTKTYQAASNDYTACGSATDCEEGYVNDSGNCRAPVQQPVQNGKNQYADNANSDAETVCPKGIPSTGTWVTLVGGMTQAEACDFTCPTGDVRDVTNRTCTPVNRGQYVDSGGNSVKNCNDGATDTDAWTAREANAWAEDQSGVGSAEACKVECLAPKVWTSSAQIACIALGTGQYEDSDGVVQNCWMIATMTVPLN